MEWHPIATAPRDGTEVLIATTAGHVYMARWRPPYAAENIPEHWLIWQENDYEFATYALESPHNHDEIVTRWMPVPKV